MVAEETRVHSSYGRSAIGPPAAVKTVRPKLFRRASLTSWGKDNLGMTRAAADVNVKELMLTVQQQKYEDRDKASQRNVSYTESRAGQASIQHRNERRARLLSRSYARREFLANWEREGREKWNSNQAALCRYERRLLSYELAVKARATAQQRISRARHASDEVGGIQWFEKNLDKLGLDPGGSGAGEGGSNLLPDKESQATFRSKLLRAVLDQRFELSSNAEAMSELHFKGAAGRRARHEREHRRLKTEVDQRHAKADTEAQRKANEHMDSMLQVGREKRAVAMAHWESRRAGVAETIRDSERFAALKAAEQCAFESAFDERAFKTRERYATEQADRNAVVEALNTKLRLNRSAKRQRAETLCAEVALKIIDLAVVASEARTGRGGLPLPPTMWMHLTRWFCSSEPFFAATSAPESTAVPRNIALEANAFLERRNLDKCEGQWRPHGLPSEIHELENSPLDAALAIARDLVEATGPGPREPPSMYCGTCSDGRHEDGGHLSVKLVLLGSITPWDRMCSELGRWTGLYCCSIETALECAMEVATEMAAANAKSAGDKKKSKSIVAGKKGIAGGVGSDVKGGAEEHGEAGAVAAETAEKDRQEALNRRSFHLEAREEDVAAFKEAAAAYYALCTNPKKAGASIPVSITTDVLAKHLSCRAPQGRGWILVGYPSSILEAKMLESALTGYSDEDVRVELGGGTRATKVGNKKQNISLTPKEDTPEAPAQSGLDAVLKLSAVRSDRSCSHGQDENGTIGTVQGSHPDALIDNDMQDTQDVHVSVTGVTAEVKAVKTGEKSEAALTETGEGIPGAKRRELVEWWSIFEGGHLTCDVPSEMHDERQLETLFILVIIAQNRKMAYEAWVRENTAARDMLAEASAVAGASEVALPSDVEVTSTPGEDSSSPVARASPLDVPLTDSLEHVRNQRRRGMTHAMRIRVEALSGERELDIQGVRTVIARVENIKGGGEKSYIHEKEASPVATAAPKISPTEALQRLEANCTASFVVDWVAAAEFSFACKLREPDERWTAACLRLEQEVAAFVARCDKATVNGKSRGRTHTICGQRREVGHGDLLALKSAPAEGDRVWDALEDFELGAGDVVDNRHEIVSMASGDIVTETQERMHTWVAEAVSAAADLCAVERDAYLDIVASLRDFDALFGLDEHGSSGLEPTRTAARNAAAGLTVDSLIWSGGEDRVNEKGIGNGGDYLECLQEQILLAQEEVSPADRTTTSFSNVTTLGTSMATRDPVELSGDPAREGEHSAIGQEVTSGFGTGSEEWYEPGVGNGNNSTKGEQGESQHSHNRDTDHPREKGTEGTLGTALWKCRHVYVCRIRGVLGRLATAVKRCETLTSSTLERIKRSRCRRVQLEHECVCAAASTVRRALEDCDKFAMEDMLQHGIPLWVEDNDTFAADPGVALPWGMNALGLVHISSLTVTLRQTFGRSTNAGDDVAILAPELSLVVRAWAGEVAATACAGAPTEEVPSAWVTDSNTYVETLCQAFGRGLHENTIPWRRLVHCLLLSHVQALPTLDELYAMRQAFQLKVSSTGCLSAGALPTPGEAGLVREVPPPTPFPQQPCTSIIIPQKQLVGIRLWFEEETEGAIEVRGIPAEGRISGKSSSGDVSSSLKAVYWEAWSDDDGRLDALEFLLTLCAVPDDDNPSTTSPGINSSGDGILFSLGLFRAFTLLAEARPSSTLPTSQSPDTSLVPAPGEKVLCAKPPNLKNAAESSTNILEDGEPPGLLFEARGGPHVTRAQLGAILQHEGMSAADVSEVFEIAWGTDEVDKGKQRARQKSQDNARKIGRRSAPEHGGTDSDEEKKKTEGEAETVEVVVSTTAAGRAMGDNTPTSNIDGTPDVDALTSSGGIACKPSTSWETTPRQLIVKGEAELIPKAHADGPGAEFLEEGTKDKSLEVKRAQERDNSRGEVGDVMPLQEDRKVSFAAVSQCAAVRTMVRGGAYRLPSFDVTSGRCRDPDRIIDSAQVHVNDARCASQQLDGK